MTPQLQRRHFDYVLGPNQDARLASVATGTTLTELVLQMDNDAPFVLTGRAVRRSYDAAFGLGGAAAVGMPGLATRWTGPNRDYRSSGGRPSYVRESLQSAFYGMFGNPKPIVPGILYPPGSVLMLDLTYTGALTMKNLTFYFRGYKLYPADTVPAYTYPRRMATLPFAYPVPVVSLGINETRRNQLFTVKTDADFVVRGGQSFTPNFTAKLAEVAIILRDFNKQPYSSDFVPLDVLFGTAPTAFQVSLGTAFLKPAFGTGPGAPGLFYPEIYVPKNHQLLYDIQRTDGTILSADSAQSFTFNLIGSKVFNR